MMKPQAELIEEMALVLRTMGTDLGDEREVIRTLIGARYLSGDVIALMDSAIERARVDAATSEAVPQ